MNSLDLLRMTPAILVALALPVLLSAEPTTTLSIVGGDFHLNGQPTYSGRTWNGHRIDGLVLSPACCITEGLHTSNFTRRKS